MEEETKIVAEQLEFPYELACELFAVFSRFEYALKEAGYYRAGRNNAAEPDWERFGQEITQEFERRLAGEVADAVAYLKQEPPSRQVVQHGTLNWQALVLPNAAEAVKALLSVRIVRNNLFHGGKHTPHSPPGRDEKLVRAALVILKACLAAHNAVRTEYETTA